MSLAALEQCLVAPVVPPKIDSEQAFHQLWCTEVPHHLSASEQAVRGGMLADRLAWVFAAGYQASLRSAFPFLPPGGWAAYAATEDTHDPEQHPGVTLAAVQDGFELSGYKSWVGHSRVVEHLVVSINDPDGDKRRARGVVLARSAPGVHLTHRESPAFLSALSQGYARFDRVPVAPGQVFGFEPMRQFGRTEAKFVMLAATAFMLVQTPGAAALKDELMAVGATLCLLLTERETSREAYGALDRQFQRAVAAFETKSDMQLIPDYAADRRMLRMYTERIQRRAGYARQARESGA